MQDLAGSHVELVAKDSELVLYLFDAENKPVPAKAAATATILATGQQETVTFVAGDSNAMRVERSIHRGAGNEGGRLADAAGPEGAVGPIYPLD